MIDGDDIFKMFGLHVCRRIWLSWDWRWQMLSILPAAGIALAMPLVLYAWLIHPLVFAEPFVSSIPLILIIAAIVAATVRFKNFLAGLALSVMFPGSNLEKKFLELKSKSEERLRQQVDAASKAKGEEPGGTPVKIRRSELEFEMYKQMLASFFKIDLDRVERRAGKPTAKGDEFHTDWGIKN